MRKLDALRQHLLDAVPDLKRNPDKMLTFVQNGRIKFHRGQHLSHEYIVPAQIIITDYSEDLDALIIPLLQWLNIYEPGIDPDEAISLEAEILNNHAYDIALSVQLTERVVAIVDCEAGTINADHRMPEYPIDACPSTHWTLYLRKLGMPNEYTVVAEWSTDVFTAASEDPFATSSGTRFFAE